jgi:hypothetical protein
MSGEGTLGPGLAPRHRLYQLGRVAARGGGVLGDGQDWGVGDKLPGARGLEVCVGGGRRLCHAGAARHLETGRFSSDIGE